MAFSEDLDSQRHRDLVNINTTIVFDMKIVQCGICIRIKTVTEIHFFDSLNNINFIRTIPSCADTKTASVSALLTVLVGLTRPVCMDNEPPVYSPQQRMAKLHSLNILQWFVILSRKALLNSDISFTRSIRPQRCYGRHGCGCCHPQRHVGTGRNQPFRRQRHDNQQSQAQQHGQGIGQPKSTT